ncbi:hypothetical protein JTB14_027966 [Gonioctena quinquepunctata]|nr:hypothetical protein JTB14_027966 [Gonioctena quinquepunctata]
MILIVRVEFNLHLMILAPEDETPSNPCKPSPCGPNSQCREVNNQAVCSCLPNHIGSPPGCRPECTVSAECPQDKACTNQKCVDPCPGTCGLNADCKVINHSPICSCRFDFSGDPFYRCYSLPPPQPIQNLEPYRNPCMPSPCGPNSQCRDVGMTPSCSCQANYFGSPPNCRPECVINSDCSSNLACIKDKCRDPCPGACGTATMCSVLNHTPICSCPEGYTGDPFISCQPKPPQLEEPIETDPCNPSPCGANSQCDNGICSCLPEYHGDPYRGCRPECVLNSDCSKEKACSRNKCIDPCKGTCGQNAECSVMNHVAICYCISGYQGNAFLRCSKLPAPIITNPCIPSPCGSNSQCRDINGQAVCSCVPGFIGSPPTCRPECISSTECLMNEACVNQKCINPCPGTCGINAICRVVNHNPICSCSPGLSGDPFLRCFQIAEEPVVTTDPSILFLLSGFIGTPPNCKPECVSNGECASHLACINQKCKDPCPGVCGHNAECRVISHTPNCVCSPGLIGDPFSGCSVPPSPPSEIISPCTPSPCGANALCREQNNAGSCTCLPEYIGNPYEGCRPECILNSDCPSNKACMRNKCQDPCPGTCGQNAECQVINHLPLVTVYQDILEIRSDIVIATTTSKRRNTPESMSAIPLRP